MGTRTEEPRPLCSTPTRLRMCHYVEELAVTPFLSGRLCLVFILICYVAWHAYAYIPLPPTTSSLPSHLSPLVLVID
jgi:hypothetical protein